jgi:hypothetical protein
MSQFALNGYRTGDLHILNRPRKFYQAHSLSDVTFADGLTIDPRIFARRQGSNNRTFSWEQPSKSDFDLWDRAIRSIYPRLRLPSSLGPYLSAPHIPYQWMASNSEDLLYHLFPGGHDTFHSPLPILFQHARRPLFHQDKYLTRPASGTQVCISHQRLLQFRLPALHLPCLRPTI